MLATVWGCRGLLPWFRMYLSSTLWELLVWYWAAIVVYEPLRRPFAGLGRFQTSPGERGEGLGEVGLQAVRENENDGFVHGGADGDLG